MPKIWRWRNREFLMKSLRILYLEIDIFFVAVIKVIFSLISLKNLPWLFGYEFENEMCETIYFYFLAFILFCCGSRFHVRRLLIGSSDFFDQSELFAAPRKQNDKEFRYIFGTFHHSIAQPRLSLWLRQILSLSYRVFSYILSWWSKQTQVLQSFFAIFENCRLLEFDK